MNKRPDQFTKADEQIFTRFRYAMRQVEAYKDSIAITKPEKAAQAREVAYWNEQADKRLAELEANRL